MGPSFSGEGLIPLKRDFMRGQVPPLVQHSEHSEAALTLHIPGASFLENKTGKKKKS